jgi:hypothetical protein
LFQLGDQFGGVWQFRRRAFRLVPQEVLREGRRSRETFRWQRGRSIS